MAKLFLPIAVIMSLIVLNDVHAETSSPDTELFKIHPPEDIDYLKYPVGIMERTTYEAYNFNPYKDKPAKISYTVTKTGWVRLRLARRDDKSLLLRTLQDWTCSKYGTTYEVKWDGKDSSENIVDNKRVFILFEAKDQEDLKEHQRHPEKICKDPELKIIHPKAKDNVKGETKIVAILPEHHVVLDNEAGYEGRLYIDYNLSHKERFNKEQREFNFILNTTSIENGVHILTINIDDHHDHIGTASIILKIQN